jgi:class 3 adenylate cyclase/pimeloyl-ACP methyl ester carboxylesterase
LKKFGGLALTPWRRVLESRAVVAPIHYVRTADDCAIAYTVSGAGPPLVYLQPYSHQQIDQDHPIIGPWYERLARLNTLVRLDARGFGLSGRDPSKVTIRGQMSDVEAVTERLGLEHFALAGISGQGFTAVMYAARHPDRVASLLTWGTPAGGFRDSRNSVMSQIASIDPDLTLDAQARWISGDVPSDREAWRQYLGSTTDIAALGAYLEQMVSTNITAELAAIRCPSVVVHPTLHAHLPLADSHELASRVADSEFVVAGARVYPHLGPDLESNERIFLRFLGHYAPELAAGPGVSRVGTAFHTILFTDLESSTAITQRIGDDLAQEILRGHNRIVRDALREFGGRQVKHTGDGIMADFPSAVGAVRAALRIREQLAGSEVRARVGLNAGEPIEEDGDLFGTAVQLAARLCGYAEPGQIVVSNVVKELCAGKGLLFGAVQLVELKGFVEPVAICRVAAGPQD